MHLMSHCSIMGTVQSDVARRNCISRAARRNGDHATSCCPVGVHIWQCIFGNAYLTSSKFRFNHVWQEGLPHHAAMSEVAVHISNHTIHKQDRGLVVVGASSHLGDLGDGLGALPLIVRSRLQRRPRCASVDHARLLPATTADGAGCSFTPRNVLMMRGADRQSQRRVVVAQLTILIC